MCRLDRLAWIFFDEIHKVETDQETDFDFRQVFQSVGDVAQYGVPIIAMTATAPSNSLLHLFEVLGIDQWDIIRTVPVSRGQIALDIIRSTTFSESLHDLKAYVEHWLALYGDDDRMMIFTQYVKTADQVA